jgi:hypothetical protein
MLSYINNFLSKYSVKYTSKYMYKKNKLLICINYILKLINLELIKYINEEFHTYNGYTALDNLNNPSYIIDHVKFKSTSCYMKNSTKKNIKYKLVELI